MLYYMANNNNRANRRANNRNSNRPQTRDFQAPAAERKNAAAEAEQKRAEAFDKIERFSNAKVSRDNGGIVLDLPENRSVPVTLGTETYDCFPPKIATLMDQLNLSEGEADDLESVDSLWTWIDLAFDEESAARIEERIKDSMDSLDIVHIAQVMKLVMENEADAPFTS